MKKRSVFSWSACNSDIFPIDKRIIAGVNYKYMETMKTVTIYVLLTTVLVGILWITHLRFNDVEKARCEQWAWKVCQNLDK